MCDINSYRIGQLEVKVSELEETIKVLMKSIEQLIDETYNIKKYLVKQAEVN